MTHDLNTQPIQCNYAVSKTYINSISTQTYVKSPHFPIYLQIKDNYFKVQLEIDLYLLILYHDFHTKAQPLEQIHQHKIQKLTNNNFLSETYPIIQHADVTLNTNKTEPYTSLNQDKNYEELIIL